MKHICETLLLKNIPLKNFKKEGLARCTMTKANIERLRLNMFGDGAMGRCPVQLGWSPLSEWMCSGDVCRQSSKQTEFVDLLACRCTCGQVSFQVVDKNDVHTPVCSSEEWTGIILHALKEKTVQKFMSAGFIAVIRGTVDAIDDECNIVRRDFTFAEEKVSKCVSLCMASVIQANKLDELIQKAVAKYHPAELVSSSGRGEKLDQGRIRFFQNIPWPEVYAYGEFNICRDWMDIDTQVLRLQREIKLEGDVYGFRRGICWSRCSHDRCLTAY